MKNKLKITIGVLLSITLQFTMQSDKSETYYKPINNCEHPGCAKCYPVLKSNDTTCLSCINSKPVTTKNGLHYCDLMQKPSIENCYHIDNNDEECLKCKEKFGLLVIDPKKPKYKICKRL